MDSCPGTNEQEMTLVVIIDGTRHWPFLESIKVKGRQCSDY